MLLVGMGVVTGDIGVLGNMIIISALMVAAPQVIFSYEGYRSIKDMESNFPKLVVNLTESLRSGMPLEQAIISASRYDYGKLTSEVKKMSNQLSWKVSIAKVLDQLSERLVKSRRLYVSIKTIKESYFSGGDVSSTLEHVADNINILSEIESERRSILNQYVVLMYAIAIIFVGIVGAINKFMVPIFQVTSTESTNIQGFGQGFSFSNPCNGAGGVSQTICNFYSVVASIFTKDTTSIKAYYIALFFSMSLVQGIFSGLIAGAVSEGSITAGFKHALIMSIMVFGAFAIMVRIGFVG